MTLFTMGFTQKTAEKFFGTLKENKIKLLVDIRLNNNSQLAGFTKEQDLRYFLKVICDCDYVHAVEYAPTKEILDGYKKKIIIWDSYVKRYNELMEKRGSYKSFISKFGKYENICLLCSEATSENCHRRLLAELIIKENPKVKLVHL